MNPVKSRQSIEDGRADVRWANERLNSFFAASKQLSGETDQPNSPRPPIDVAAALQYRRNAQRLLATAEVRDRKKLLRSCTLAADVAWHGVLQRK